MHPDNPVLRAIEATHRIPGQRPPPGTTLPRRRAYGVSLSEETYAMLEEMSAQSGYSKQNLIEAGVRLLHELSEGMAR